MIYYFINRGGYLGHIDWYVLISSSKKELFNYFTKGPVARKCFKITISPGLYLKFWIQTDSFFFKHLTHPSFRRRPIEWQPDHTMPQAYPEPASPPIHGVRCCCALGMKSLLHIDDQQGEFHRATRLSCWRERRQPSVLNKRQWLMQRAIRQPGYRAASGPCRNRWARFPTTGQQWKRWTRLSFHLKHVSFEFPPEVSSWVSRRFSQMIHFGHPHEFLQWSLNLLSFTIHD